MWKNLLVFACFCTLASVASAAGLDVYLPLDGNVNDYSGNGNNGVLVDGAAGINSYVAGVAGQSLDLGLAAGDTEANAESTLTDGDYVAVDYTLADEGTIALWYKKAPFDYNYESVWDNSGTSSHPGDNWECWIDQWGPGHLYARSPDGADGRWGDAVNRGRPVRLGRTRRRLSGRVDAHCRHVGEARCDDDGKWTCTLTVSSSILRRP